MSQKSRPMVAGGRSSGEKLSGVSGCFSPPRRRYTAGHRPREREEVAGVRPGLERRPVAGWTAANGGKAFRREESSGRRTEEKEEEEKERRKRRNWAQALPARSINYTQTKISPLQNYPFLLTPNFTNNFITLSC